MLGTTFGTSLLKRRWRLLDEYQNEKQSIARHRPSKRIPGMVFNQKGWHRGISHGAIDGQSKKKEAPRCFVWVEPVELVIA